VANKSTAWQIRSLDHGGRGVADRRDRHLGAGRATLPADSLVDHALGGGWALNGMETNFFVPGSDVKFAYQSTVALEKEIAERSFLFVEYVGNFPSNGRNSQWINSGGGYRIDDRHQIDFHVGVGLNRNAPNYIFGVGYSFRLDGFLQQRDRTLAPSPSAGLTTR